MNPPSHDQIASVLDRLEEIDWDAMAILLMHVRRRMTEEETRRFDFTNRNIRYVIETLTRLRSAFPGAPLPQSLPEPVDPSEVDLSQSYGDVASLPTHRRRINEKMPGLREWYPLHEAVSITKSGDVALMLAHGADPYKVGRDDCNAFQIAEKIGDRDVKKTLDDFWKNSRALGKDTDEIKRRAHGRGRGFAFGHYKKTHGIAQSAMSAIPATPASPAAGHSGGRPLADEQSDKLTWDAHRRTKEMLAAVRAGDMDRVKKLAIDVDINTVRDESGRKLAAVAAEAGHPGLADYLASL